MASQITVSKFLTSSFGGAPMRMDSSTAASPTSFHQTETIGSDKQQMVFLEVHNNDNSRVPFVIYWMPNEIAAGTGNSAATRYNIAPFETLVISNGRRIGQSFNEGGISDGSAFSGYVENVADIDKLRVIGHIIELDQSGI